LILSAEIDGRVQGSCSCGTRDSLIIIVVVVLIVIVKLFGKTKICVCCRNPRRANCW